MTKTRLEIWQARGREWLEHDSILFATAVRGGIGLLGLLLFRLGSRKVAFQMMSYVHCAARPRRIVSWIEAVMRKSFPADNGSGEFDACLQAHIDSSEERAPANLVDHPEKMLINQAIVLGSAFETDGRGVIVVKYNYSFPLFVKQYDFRRILERYHVVIEPSWSGYCEEDILALNRLRPQKIFVQTGEPRDEDFLAKLNANFLSVPVAANWWVDHRTISADPDAARDLDFVLVASWADFKRHHRVFAALKALRKKGHELKGACLGYPSGRTMQDIRDRAAYYGVDDLLEFHQKVPQEIVSRYLNRSKVNVLWSRREGFNRVVIEGMYCDTPCLIPENFNFGYRYPYINEHTGRWSNDSRLENDLLEMTARPWPHSPAEWVRSHMTPQHAVEILSASIGSYCARVGEPEPGPLVAKYNKLGSMKYWDRDDESRFYLDYEYLRDCLKQELPSRAAATA